MKKRLLPFFCSLSVLAACQSQPVPSTGKPSFDSAKGLAVVELFTSQGCSSCPPADELLGREIAAANKTGKKLIALSFHVDYWNRLGWIDPFSQHQFSQRQYGYSAKMKGDGVYTPQVIVNGQQQAVGGNQQKVEGFIKTALAEKAAATLQITSAESSGNNLSVAYGYNGPAADLHIAVVEKQTSTLIKTGENGGHTLPNYNVVRIWKTIAVETGNRTAEIEIPAGYDTGKYAVILYAQGKDYGKMLAADMK